MAINKRLDRRHDVNAGERLPERHTRVLDEEAYRESIEKVLENEMDEDFRAGLEADKEAMRAMMEEKKASIKEGDLVLLLWTGVQVSRVEEVTERGVRIAGHRYGWEMVQKPSEAFLEALRAEVGEVQS